VARLSHCVCVSPTAEPEGGNLRLLVRVPEWGRSDELSGQRHGRWSLVAEGQDLVLLWTQTKQNGRSVDGD